MHAFLKASLLLLILDALLFKISWVLLVVMQSDAVHYGAVLVVIRMVMLPDHQNRLLPTALVLATGLFMDLMLTVAGLYEFSGRLLPLWLVLLWASFALTLTGSFSMLLGWPYWLLAVTGLVSGCLSYVAGNLLGAVAFGYPLPLATGMIAVAWSIYLPMTVCLINKLTFKMVVP